MTDHRTITAEQELIECSIGPGNCGKEISLFRAPVILDGSGYYKRLPHQIDWEHVQVGDAIIALSMHKGHSGREVIDILQFWHVLKQEDEGTFRVAVNNVVGMAGDGKYVYNRIAAMVDLPLQS